MASSNGDMSEAIEAMALDAKSVSRACSHHCMPHVTFLCDLARDAIGRVIQKRFQRTSLTNNNVELKMEITMVSALLLCVTSRTGHRLF